jgi:hypothetical protein
LSGSFMHPINFVPTSRARGDEPEPPPAACC